MSCSTSRMPMPSSAMTPRRMAAKSSVSLTSSPEDGSRRRRHEPGAGAEGRGLAGAVGADQPGDRPTPGDEADVVDGDETAEADGDPLHLQVGAGTGDGRARGVVEG